MKRLVISRLILNDKEAETLTQALNILDEIASNDELPEAFDARLIYDSLNGIMDNTILDSDSESEDFFITPSDYDVIIDCSPNMEDPTSTIPLYYIVVKLSILFAKKKVKNSKKSIDKSYLLMYNINVIKR